MEKEEKGFFRAVSKSLYGTTVYSEKILSSCISYLKMLIQSQVSLPLLSLIFPRNFLPSSTLSTPTTRSSKNTAPTLAWVGSIK